MSNKRAPTSHIVRDQMGGVAVNAINTAREQREAIQQSLQDEAFEKAASQIDAVYKFIGSPENILGNAATKHGEIAEQVEVGVRNAKAALSRQACPATFD